MTSTSLLSQISANEYKKQYYATLDALYAKEIQDIYVNYLDTNMSQNEKSNELKVSLRKYHQKLETLKLNSAPLAITVLNCLYGLSSHTRDNLDTQIIQDMKKILLTIYNIFKHSMFANELMNKEESIIGEEEDFERILYLIVETCFNLARDGIKYRKSKEIFNHGVSLFARILGGLNKNALSEKLQKNESRYDQLENAINDSGLSASEIEKIKECTRLLKRRYLSESKEEQAEIDNKLVEHKFNVY